MTSAHKEVEAKFIVRRPAFLQILSRLQALGGFSVVSRSRERQRNIYWDTADLRLRRAGTALKLRVVGRRAELTLKRSLGYHQGVEERLEVTAPIRSANPRVLSGRQRNIAPLRLANSVVGHRPLQPLFTLWTDRRRILLARNAQRVEIDIDRVTYRRGKTHASRLEVEIENLNASASAFRRVLEEFRRRFKSSVRASRVSKYEFGFSLVSPNVKMSPQKRKNSAKTQSQRRKMLRFGGVSAKS